MIRFEIMLILHAIMLAARRLRSGDVRAAMAGLKWAAEEISILIREVLHGRR